MPLASAGALVLVRLLRQTLLQLSEQLLDCAPRPTRHPLYLLGEAARAKVDVSDGEQYDDDYDNQHQPAQHSTLPCGFPAQQHSPSVKRWGLLQAKALLPCACHEIDS